MQSKREHDGTLDEGPPWSPVSVSVIALLLPAGGAILTIRNLYRLRQHDAASAKRLMYAAYGIFALGFTALLLSAHKAPHGSLQLDTGASTVLSCGVAVASYMVQRAPYRSWRIAHQHVRPSPWLGGAGRAIMYTLITFAVVLPLAITGIVLGVNGLNAGSV
jgi:hypothetical protein